MNPPPQPLNAVNVPNDASNSMPSVIQRLRRLPGMKNNPIAANADPASGHVEVCAVCCVPVTVCTVRLDEALADPGVTLAGAKLAVAPAGNPLIVNPTGLLNVPPLDATVTLNVVDPPGCTVCDEGEPVTPKSAGLRPVPERAIVCGDPSALSATDNVAVKLAADAGINVT